MKIFTYIMELLGITSLIGLIAYITWTKMALGATLSLIGAFFPELHIKKDPAGEGKIDIGKVSVVFRGGLRFVVVLSGLILIIGAILDGHEGFIKAEGEKAAQFAAMFAAQSVAQSAAQSAAQYKQYKADIEYVQNFCKDGSPNAQALECKRVKNRLLMWQYNNRPIMVVPKDWVEEIMNTEGRDEKSEEK